MPSLRETSPRFKANLIVDRLALDAGSFGKSLRRENVGEYLFHRQAQVKDIQQGIQICAFGVPLGVVEPIFMNGEGWLYPVSEIELVLDQDQDHGNDKPKNAH